MAEIHIERKRGGSRLLWIILLLVIIALAVYAWMTYGNRLTPAEQPPTVSLPHSALQSIVEIS